MALRALSYIALETKYLDDWRQFATGLLGMQHADSTVSTSTFRMDTQRARLFLSKGRAEGANVIGWECADRADLDQLAARVEAQGISVKRASRDLADQRFVTELIQFPDPLGNRLEVCWSPNHLTVPFMSARPISGFLTGPLGMGHVVMHVKNVGALLPFYRDVLGFRISDYGLAPYPVYFFHLNSRHHSIAMVESGRSGLHHFMVELTSLDDVGQAYDLAQLEPDRVAYTLGRHTNDFMVSFYARSPSDFFVEYGWGGRNIDVSTWVPHETAEGPSFWGHDRLALPPELRDSFRNLRLAAAAKGLRAPLDSRYARTDTVGAVVGRE